MESVLKNRKLLFKLVVVGDCGSGKSALIVRYTDDVFNDGYISTIGVDFRSREPEIGGMTVTLQIWDTAGQERFRTITRGYWRGADGILVVYSVAQPETFENVKRWMAEIESCELDNPVKMLVAAKADLEHERVVSREAGEALAKSLGIPYMETSAKTGLNVEELFTRLASEIRDKKLEELIQLTEREALERLNEEDSRRLSLREQQSSGLGKCCS